MEEEKKTTPKYEVHFGVYIPELKKTYTKQELVNDQEACQYLLEIGSAAVTELKTI